MVASIDKLIDRETIELLDLEPQESAKLAGLRYIRADSDRAEKSRSWL